MDGRGPTLALLLLAACNFEHGALPGTGPGDTTATDGGGGSDDAAAGRDAAAGFDLTRCPSGYVDVTGAPGSRYRLITTTRGFWDQNDDCNNDGTAPEIAHLVVLGSQAEANVMAGISGGRFYIGAAQDPNQTVKSANWHMFDGNPPASAWAVNDTPSEPSDADGVENGQEQVAIADTNTLMSDAGGITLYRAICECDGIPIAANVMIPPRP